MNKELLNLVPLLIVIVILISLPVNYALAGELGKFEKDATKERPRQRHDRHRNYNDNNWWGGLATNFVSALVEIPMRTSWARATGDPAQLTEFGCELRKPGDPLLPFVRFDASYLTIEPDVDAFDYRIQIGYGTFALELNQTRYEEKEPPDQLDFYRLYGLFRLSYSNKVEVDLGVGSIILEGDERHSGLSTTTPIIIHPCDWFIVEFRPMWSNINGSAIDEYELGFLFNYDFMAIKAGYRWTRSPQESLNGPFIGASIRY
jgi:hypothetical protein